VTGSRHLAEPAVLGGPAGLRAAIAASGGPAIALVDRVVSETAAGREALCYIRSQPQFAAVRVVEGSPQARDLVEIAAARPGIRLVVGIGGGCVIDQVKLLAGLYRRDDTTRYLSVSQRAGWTSLRADAEREVTLVVVPTTLGTGAEMSRVACLESAAGKRLIEGAVLRADAAVYDARMTATLPGALVMEGIFEAWSRLLGALGGAAASVASEDALATGAATRLTELGFEARDELLAGGAPGEELRHEVARLSAMSHSHWLHLSRPPFAYKAWFLATELAGHAGTRKVPAMAAVLPPVWEEILSGGGVLGDRRALLRAWRAIRAVASADLPADPVDGLRRLLASWGVAASAGDVNPEAVARGAIRRWGAGLPMLGGTDLELLKRVFEGCLETATNARTEAYDL